MKINPEVYNEKLKNSGIKPSIQRIKILEYLANNPCHPTVDKIYTVLHPSIPTLSKTTVYNTLKSFVSAKLVREITIEDNEVRYEYNLEDHGHFKCLQCGNVYDFFIDISSFNSGELDGFEISDKNVYFRGICRSCKKHQV